MVSASPVSHRDYDNKHGNTLDSVNDIIYKVEFGLMLAALI